MTYADIDRRRERQREYYANNREVIAARHAERYRKTHPDAGTSERQRVISAEPGTPEYRREIKRRFRERHPERVREQTRRASELHRERTPGENAHLQTVYRQCGMRWRKAERAAWVEPIVPLVVYELADGVCWICDEDVAPDRYEIDHIIPLAAGGEHSYENVRLAHVACNRKTSRQGRPR